MTRLRKVTPGETTVYDVLTEVEYETLRLLRDQPHLAGEDPRALFARLITPETAPDYASALRRAAFAVLLVRAIDRAEQANFTSGDAA